MFIMESRLKRTLETLLSAYVVVVVGVLAFLAVSVFMDIPDVYVSNSTGECVRIIEYNTGVPEIKDCSELPSKYNLVWIK